MVSLWQQCLQILTPFTELCDGPLFGTQQWISLQDDQFGKGRLDADSQRPSTYYS